MTTRKWHDQAREHVLSARKRNNNTALGDHYREHQNEKEKNNLRVTEETEEVIKERVRQDKVTTKNQLQDHQTPAGSSATAHRGAHRHQATQTNPQPPTGDARYGLSSSIFFSPVLLHYLDIHLHAPHFPSLHLYVFIILTFTRTFHTTPNLTPVPPPHTGQRNSSSLT